MRYALSRWEGLTRFIDDGRIEIDSNVVERVIRPIALNRKNALFAGSDGGGEHWAIVASLIETCKLNGVDPQGYVADVLTKIVNMHPNSQIDDLMPWAYAPQKQPLRDVAGKHRLLNNSWTASKTSVQIGLWLTHLALLRRDADVGDRSPGLFDVDAFAEGGGASCSECGASSALSTALEPISRR
jgi:hypothetical protein